MQYKAYPKQANFVGSLWSNQEMLDEQAVQFGKRQNNALRELLNRIEQDKEYDIISNNILELFLTVPTLAIQQNNKLDNYEVDRIIDMVIKAIKR